MVYFIKKRDPRVKAMEKHAAEQKEAEARLAAERRAEQAAEYRRAKEEQQQQLSSDEGSDELEQSSDEERITFSCSVVIVFEGAEQTHSASGDTDKAARLAAASKAIAALSSAKQFQSKKNQAALRGNAVAALNKLWQKSLLADKPEYVCTEGAAAAAGDSGESDEEGDEQRGEEAQDHAAEQDLEPEPEPAHEGELLGGSDAEEDDDDASSAAAESRRARVEQLRAHTQRDTDTDTETETQRDRDVPGELDEDGEEDAPACTCASCVQGGKCISEMTEKEKKKFEKQQVAAEKARLWREEHGQEADRGEDNEEGEGEAAETKKDKKKKKLQKVEKKSERRRAGRCKT